MARKSRNKEQMITSSSEDSDPDYEVRSSTRMQSRRNNCRGYGRNLEISDSGENYYTTRYRRSRPQKRHAFNIEESSSMAAQYSSSDGRNQRYATRRSKRSEIERNRGKKKWNSTIFSWLLDSKTLQEFTKIVYLDSSDPGHAIKEAVITSDGAICSCCGVAFAPEGFQIHAAKSLDKPYEKIFIENTEISLLACMIEAWNNADESQLCRFNLIEAKVGTSDSYDDACIICADGGNLMCCDQCNSTYHQHCIGMEGVPRGSWCCPYCVCKICGQQVNGNDYLLTCSQCEKRYHWECYQEVEPMTIDMNSDPCPPFCEKSCKEVHEILEKDIVGVKNELDEGYFWTLIHRVEEIDSTSDDFQRVLCHSKLTIARRLMEDCFETIIDRHTGINMIQSVVYNCGSNFNRINFKGFYTAVLEKDEEIISAASLRIHGTKLAEMPFIATSEPYRGKGMCRRLMIAIESTLCYLKVENLVIPSVPEKIGSWVERYGFRRLDGKLKKEIVCRNTLMFHDSIRLQKTMHSPPARRVREAENNNGGMNLKNKSKMPPLFDLNLQPSP